MSTNQDEMKKRIDFQYPPLTRRQFVKRGAAATAGLLLVACGQNGEGEEKAVEEVAVSESRTITLEPTPQCSDDDDETIAQTEGPFYTPDSPERTSFLEDGSGTRMVLSGRVLTMGCVPIAGAIVDFWHADDGGNYDNVGYLFRGHQFTDADGRFQLETVVPGLYPGRTRHFHVKVQGPETALLTTQLYFPGEAGNTSDGIYDERLLMETAETAEGMTGTFDFVL